MAHLLKVLRTLHSWLGVIVLPWIIIFGISGFYLNHPDAVRSVLPFTAYNDQAFDFAELPVPLSTNQAADIAREIWPDSEMQSVTRIQYHGYDAIEFNRAAGRIIVVPNTGHYYVKSNLQNKIYTPAGDMADRKIYWDYVLGVFHRTGWLGWSLGTILADLTALALIGFGLTGIALWYLPRHKRFKRRLSALGLRKTA